MAREFRPGYEPKRRPSGDRRARRRHDQLPARPGLRRRQQELEAQILAGHYDRIKQAAIAAQCGVSQSTVSRWMRKLGIYGGSQKPTGLNRTLNVLAAANLPLRKSSTPRVPLPSFYSEHQPLAAHDCRNPQFCHMAPTPCSTPLSSHTKRNLPGYWSPSDSDA